MDPIYKKFLVKLGIIILISPLIGSIAFQIVENLKKARSLKGIKKGIALAIVGFLIAILLGWLQ